MERVESDPAAEDDRLPVWERRILVVDNWLPHGLLALGVTLALIQPDQSWSHRLGTLGLVAGTALWVFLAHTRAPENRRERILPMAVYFLGVLGLGTLLSLRSPVFFVFLITGFFHSSLLRPWPLAVLGAGLTSFALNTVLAGWPEPTVGGVSLYLTVIVIQSVAIGLSSVAGEKLLALNEQRRQAVVRLETTLAENVGLHAQLLEQAREAGVHDERQRLAREIHDTLAQGLTGILAQVQAAKQARQNPEAWERHLDTAAGLARESLAEARRSVRALAPSALETARLVDALSDVVQRWSAQTGVEGTVTTTGDARQLHPEVEVALLRVAQEALANVGKHAKASTVRLTLSYMENLVTLDVVDDGVGFDPGAPRRFGQSVTGFGLTTMRQRVEGLSGGLAVESGPDGGTAVSASMPAISAEATHG